MNLAEFQTLAARTAPTDLSDADRRENCAMGLVGEFGELVDLLKKRKFHGHDLDNYHDGTGTTYAMYAAAIAKDERNRGHCEEWMSILKREYDAKLRDEFGDVLWYLAEAATICGGPRKSGRSACLLECGLAGYDDWPWWAMATSVSTMAASVATGGYAPDGPAAVAMMVELIRREGFTLDEVLERNVEKLRERYPAGFSARASKERVETALDDLAIPAPVARVAVAYDADRGLRLAVVVYAACEPDVFRMLKGHDVESARIEYSMHKSGELFKVVEMGRACGVWTINSINVTGKGNVGIEL